MPDIDALDWRGWFERKHEGFFARPSIRGLPDDLIYEEMALDLTDAAKAVPPVPVAGDVDFDFYGGSLAALREVVGRVDATWPELFGEGDRVYCALDGDKIASFCMVEDNGTIEGLRVGGPGCVGTAPEYRRRGIGLRMVQKVTEILRAEGYQLAYIHYTGVGLWYAKLGYRTVLRWNGKGFID